ncbi:MAG: hypothetical protein QNL61_00325, partial [Crocinitomicaceae bacterium]
MLLKILSQKHITILVCLISCVSFGQTNEETLKRADDFFEAENYVEATKDYLHLLSLEPTDADLNFKYGTCLLFNSKNKNKALRYLSYAVRNASIDPRAFFFNGKALHLDYQFENAKKSYIIYQEKRAKKDDRYKVELAIKMCDNGKKLLSTFTDIVVTNKQEISSDNFFKIYSDSKTIGGEILVVAKFQSKIDKKMNHIPVVHFPPNAKAIYYSSYGEREDTGLDIYIRRKLPDASWGDPQLLPGEVNTNENEDFPYMHPSGNFLYFSSMGHNSMGGYDVFMSRLDTETNSFFTSENVDFAISSPDDDLFYVVDSLFQNAYFASARQSEDGKFHVYKVKVARVPIQEIIVMGDFISEINPNNETMRITLTSNSNGSEVGKIVSNEKGKYSFVFPKGGKYNYEITVGSNENNVYKYVVELPFLDEFRPLKQKAIHKMVDGQEIVTIINLFDEEVEGAEAMLAEVIRKKAALDVNVDNFDLKELEKKEERNKRLSEIGFNNMSIVEVGERLNELAQGEQKRSEMIERIESNLDLATIAKSEELKKLNEDLYAILAKSEQTTDPVEKHPILMEARKIELAITKITSEISLLNVMKNELFQNIGASGTNGVNKIEVLENQFNSLVFAGKEDDALEMLIKNKDVINKASNESVENYVASLVEKSVALNKRIKELKEKQVDFELNQNTLATQISQLNSQLLVAKKKDVEDIRTQIRDRETELEMVKQLLINTKKQIIAKNMQLDMLNNSLETLQKAISNTDGAAYKKEDVEVAIKKARSIENDVQLKGIENQINEIERENPKLNSEYKANNTSVNSLKDIQKDFNEKIAEIESNRSLSAEEKLNLAQKANNVSTANTNSRINAVENELAVTPNNKILKEELNSLNSYQNELEQENVRVTDELAKMKSSSANKTNYLDEIKSNLEFKLVEIESNKSTSQIEKIDLKQAVLAESVNAVNDRLNSLKTELKSDPNNSVLQNEQSVLALYKKKLESVNLQLENEKLVANSSNSSNDLITIQNKLNQKIEAIQANNSTTEEQKIQAKQQANNESIAQVDKRLNEIKSALANDKSNTVLKSEQAQLENYKSELQSNNLSLNSELIALNNGNTPQTTQLETIQSKLKEKIAAIQENSSTTEEQKIKAKQQANNESIAQIDRLINAIEAQLSNEPDNTKMLEEQLALIQYKTTLEQENSVLGEELIALNKGNAPQANQLETIQSKLSEKIDAIKANSETSVQEKIQAKQQANNESIAQIDKRINAIEAQLLNEPDNTALLEEKLALIQYKTTIEQENKGISAELLSLSNTNSQNSATQLGDIQNKLNQKIEAIQANNSTTEEQKI